jgi:hypothetical protein
MSSQLKPAKIEAEHSKFARGVYAFRELAYRGVGPELMQMRYVINFFKGMTFIWILFLMNYFNNYSTGMYLYFCLHGSYGIFWLLKDIYYPDSSFKQMSTYISTILLATVLTLYWMIPLSIATGHGIQ